MKLSKKTLILLILSILLTAVIGIAYLFFNRDAADDESKKHGQGLMQPEHTMNP